MQGAEHSEATLGKLPSNAHNRINATRDHIPIIIMNKNTTIPFHFCRKQYLFVGAMNGRFSNQSTKVARSNGVDNNDFTGRERKDIQVKYIAENCKKHAYLWPGRLANGDGENLPPTHRPELATHHGSRTIVASQADNGRIFHSIKANTPKLSFSNNGGPEEICRQKEHGCQ